MVHPKLDDLIKTEKLGPDFQLTIDQWYTPLAKELAALHQPGRTQIIGVQGAQGSGKSTLALFLQTLLKEQYGLNGVSLSIDDFYLTRDERKLLAKSAHPLLLTRGVPGTHDVNLALSTIGELVNLEKNQSAMIPRFDKATDDRKPASSWDKVFGKIDVIIFEGWCVGAGPQQHTALDTAMNTLETEEDPHCIWRNYVNNALAHDYKKLFERLDQLVVLQAPSFDCVYEWRWLQEQKLAADALQNHHSKNTKILDQQGVKRFISHYERLTRHCMQQLPPKADYLLTLNKNHDITSLTQGESH